MRDRSVRPVLPPATLGMLGGGQLGRYFVIAAHELGYRVWVLDPDPDSPAGRIADRHLVAPYDDPAAIDELATGCRAVSTEFENVPADTLRALVARTVVHPSADAVAVAQDRIAEKAFLVDHGLPVGPHTSVAAVEDLDDLADDLFPAILKRARFGYDGKGQAKVADAAEARSAFDGFDRAPCVLERRLPLDRELSVVLARSRWGDVACFATAENRHRDGILDLSMAPAPITPEQDAEARDVAVRIAEALDYVGVLAVELFVSDGRILVNELAPRPHNSGHLTLDATVTSQYEQQVRALCGLPLGSPRPVAAAVMVNLLGDLWPAGGEPPWGAVLGVPDLKLHLYGKVEARPGRKMGHLTVLGDDPGAVAAVAERARRDIGVIDA
ncbi:MAG: 5-(carboxyamino)imidazole ribonucleotide synthase [Actinobacteria bacterium]|nr:5-(carboxyamino)imidazole ribonucleotide synthase [Actinomycetota bacterium]